MKPPIFDILEAFVTGKMDAPSAKSALAEHFFMSASAKRQTIDRQYIDEIMADLEAGMVSIESATDGLEDSADASTV